MSIVNRKQLRLMTLDAAARLRPHTGFTLVAKSFLDEMEATLRVMVENRVRALPSVGKTIK